MRIFVWLVLCVSIGLIIPPSSLLAQEASSTTKKNVVKNFKINLNEYSAFGSDCTNKPQGDANCDSQINQFDLSIWEVEFNSSGGSKRADFNNDGVVSLLDFGIWRNTNFPQQTSQRFLHNLVSSISNPKSLIINLSSLIGNIYAQEGASGGGEINSSSAFTSGSGNSFVVNNLSGGNTQQVNFNETGNPTGAEFFNSAGQSIAEVAFLDTGGTIISTEESGIPIVINKTATGPIIENFKNPDGSLLAIKSWPTQASYDKNEPPLSVTIPGQGNTRNVLNMQPNGDSILETSDASGIVSRTQLRSNGNYIYEDSNNRVTVEANSEIGFIASTLPNTLGGKTSYLFYQGALYTIVQTDAAGSTYTAKPLDAEGNSWNLESVVNGQKTEKTVANPIQEVNGGTPDPKEIIKYSNYYKSAAPSQTEVNFTDGFATTVSSLESQITKANEILTISQTQPPAVLGIVSEAKAQTNPVQRDPNSNTGGVWTEDKYTQPDGTVVQINSNGTGTQITFHTGPGATIANPVNGGAEISVGRPDFASMTGSSNPNAQAVAAGAWASALAAGKDADQARAEAVTAAAQASGTGQPAAPPPAAPPPAAPAPASGPTSQSQALAAAGTAASTAASSLPTTATPAERGLAARDAISTTLTQANSTIPEVDRFSSLDISKKADAGFVSAYLASTPGGFEITDAALSAAVANGRVQGAIDALRSATGREPSITVSDIYNPNNPIGAAAPAGRQAPATTAPQVAGPVVAARPGDVYTMGNATATVVSVAADGTITTNVVDKNGTNSTFTHNPRTGGASFSNEQFSTFSNFGHITAVGLGNNQVVGIHQTTGELVTGDRSLIDPKTGYMTGGDKVEMNSAAHRSYNTGASRHTAAGNLSHGYQIGNQKFDSCFLPGTLISTPFGPRPIETLKPGDKIYSYNEQTGAKNISDFQELDINFVDEYLVINNKIQTTIYHPFYIVSGNSLRSTRADALKIGDILRTELGKQVPVYSIQKISSPKTTVYNLTNVTPNNNFFAAGILVHNYTADVTAEGDLDPNPGGNPYNPDGSYADGWAETGGWNPDYYSPSDISPGDLGGSNGGSDVSSDLGKDSSGDGWGSSDQQQTETQSDQTGGGDSGGYDGNSVDAGGNFGGESGGGQSSDNSGGGE